MKIKEIRLIRFKRFTDLTITDIPETAKLIVLVGPNGCGKSSVFEALNHWYKWRGFGAVGEKDYYVKEGDKEFYSVNGNWFINQVQIDTFDKEFDGNNNVHGKLYFRTAHRNEPDFTTSNLSKLNNPKDKIMFDTLMKTDMSVSDNYQRLVSNTLSGVFDPNNDDKPVKKLRDELIGKIKKSLSNIFDDLQLTSIGDPLTNGSFYWGVL